MKYFSTKMSNWFKRDMRGVSTTKIVLVCGWLALGGWFAPEAAAQFGLTNYKVSEPVQTISTNRAFVTNFVSFIVDVPANHVAETVAPTPVNLFPFMANGYVEEGSDLALPNIDYVPFSVGSGRQVFTIGIINDAMVEFNEDILIRIRDVNTGVIFDLATMTIEHDDPPAGAVDLLFLMDPPYDDTNPSPGANSFVYAVADGFSNRVFNVNPGNVGVGSSFLFLAAHGLHDGADFYFQGTGLPAPAVAGRRYAVTNAVGGAFEVLDTTTGQFLVFTDSGSGFRGVGAVRKAYIGGDFTSVNSSTNKVRIARLEHDGRVDFNFDVGTGADAFVAAIAVTTNGNPVIGGAFSAVNGFSRPGVARLLHNGSVDPAFNPGLGARIGDDVGTVRAVAVYRNGIHTDKIVIGGDFTSYNGTNRAGVARLNIDGSLDTGFDVGNGANGPVYAVRIQLDGKVVIAGDFTAVNGVPRNRIARLTVNGGVDPTFVPGAGADDTVYAVALDNSNPPLVVNREASGGPAEDRFVVNAPGTTGTLTINYDFLQIPDTLTVYYPPQALGGVAIFSSGSVNGIATVSVPFSGTSSQIEIVINEGSGQFGTLWFYDAIVTTTSAAEKVIIGGSFQNFDLRGRSRIARLNADGTLDNTYQVGLGFNDTVFSLDMDPTTTRAIAGGLFTSYNWTSRTNLARLLVNGALDTSFMDTAYNQRAGPTNNSFFVQSFISAVSVQTDGNVLIGGGFTHIGGDHGRQGVGTDVGGRLFVGTDAGHTWDTFTNSAVDFIFGTPSPRFKMFGGNGGTRWGIRPRSNVARVHGGLTPTTMSGGVANIVGGPGNMEMNALNYSEDENGTNVVITVRRVNGRLGTTSINWATSNLTATAGADYTPVLETNTWFASHNFHGILMFSSGDLTNKNFRVTILDDALVEGNEDILIQAFNPVGSQLLPNTNDFFSFVPRNPPTNVIIGAAIGGNGQSVITITDNDFNFGTFNFSSPTYVVTEGAGSAVITVTRTGGSVGAVSIRYSTVPGGTAVAGVDYISVTNTLTFAAGQTSRTFSVPVNNDTAVEFDETVNLTLSNPTGGATLGSQSTAVLTIQDNDNGVGNLAFLTNSYFVSETGVVATVTVQRTSGSLGTVGVTVSTSDGTAINGIHYTAVVTNITFGNGETLKTITVPVTDDGGVNANRTINLSLSAPTGGAQLGAQSTAVLTVMNDDAFGDFSFASVEYLVGEKDTNAVITVVRRNGTSGMVTVDFASIPGGTAAPGADFTNVTGTLVFTNGQTVATFLVPVTDDGGLELEETVFLSLFNPVSGSLGSPVSATLIIIDDEALNRPAGSDDTAFNPGSGPDNFVYALATQPDRRLVVGGAFRFFNGSSRNRIVRVMPDGTLDSTFQPGAAANNLVRAVAVQPDGRTLIAGNFTVFNGTNRNFIARLNVDGSLDTLFNPGAGADNPVLALALHTNGVVYVGGDFTFAGGLPRNRVAAFNTNGTINTGFNPGTGANGTVRTVALHTNGVQAGKLVVGGDFSVFNGAAVNRLVRLDAATGAQDASFAAGIGTAITNGSIYAVAIHPDGPHAGKIVIAGVFSSFNGVARTNIARLNPDGTLDTGFAPSGGGPDSAVYALAIDKDGQILIVGEFTTVNGIGRNRFARLRADGQLDTTINTGTGANSFVAAVVTKPDGKIAIGGGFTEFNGLPRNYLAQLLGGTTPGAGTLEFSSAGFTAIENDPVATVTVYRQGGQDDAISVNYTLVGGTAVAGLDYTNFASGTLFLTNGQTSASFVVPLVDDRAVDGSKTLQFQLSNPTNLTTSGGPVAAPAILASASGPTNATLTVLDNDSVLAFSAASYSVSEGGGAINVTVLRTGGTAGPVSVRYFTADGTAAAGQDFTTVSNTLSFASGETSRTFAVNITDDALVEGNETFTIVLTNAVGEAVIGQLSVPVTIVDNEFQPGVLNFSGASYTVDENAGRAVITVTRTNGTTGVVTVQFSATAGTATAGSDFVATNGVISFADGETQKSFEVAILSDSNSTESDETVNLQIFGATGGAALGGQNNATLTIVNNNAFIFGGLRFSTNAFSVAEAAGTATITVQRVGGSTGSVSVTLLTGDGTATGGLDYTGVTNVVVFADGQTSATVDISILNEVPPLAEGAETISLVLTNATGGASLAPPSAATLTIVDDDFLPGAFVFLTNSFSANETTTNAVITVLRTNGVTGAVSVSFSATDGTAVNGVDYNSVSGTLNFPDGVSSNAFLVPLIPNPLQRGNFNVILTLSAPTGGATIGAGSALLTIIDNEPSAGSADTSFNLTSGANDIIHSLFLQADDGRLTLGGNFSQVESQIRTNVARLNADGTLESTFGSPSIGFASGASSVRSVAVHTNGTNIGKVVIGGVFSSVSGDARGNLARLNGDGTRDTNFLSTGTDSAVNAVAIQNNGRILVGGQFTTLNSSNRVFLARLEEDGVLDLSFDTGTGPNGFVRAIAVEPGGRILIGGDFTLYDGVVVGRIARLNADGSLDKTFDVGAGFDAPVRSVALQSDGRVLVGGEFTSFLTTNAVGRLARLNTDGTLDATFSGGSSGANDFISALVVQPDGRILVGGAFTMFHGLTNQHRLVRLEAGGSLDTSFNTGTGFNDFVTSLVLQPDRKIVVAGGFTRYNDVAHNRIVRLHGGENVGAGNLDFTAGLFSVSESGTNGVISVVRTRGTTNAVSVQFATADGTAVAGTHYVATNGVLVFAQNETLKHLFIPILDNTNVFGDVTINLSLFNATNLTTGLRDNALLGSLTNAVLNIVEDDSVVGFASPAFSVNEAGTSANITIRRAGGTTRPVTVDFVTSDLTALVGVDYLGLSNTVTLLPGQTAVTVSVPVINDTLVEGTETVALTLLNATNAFLGQSNAVLTIIDDEFNPGVLTFTVTNYTVLEGQPNAVITVSRTNGSSGSVSVDYLATNGTAVAGVDFLGVTNTLAFADGEVSKTFLVPIVDDNVEDDGETVALILSNPTGGAILSGISAGAGAIGAVLTIQDNDVAIGFATNALSVAETSGVNLISVFRTGLTNQALAVDFFARDGSAFGGLDFNPLFGTLNFAPGETNQSFSFTLLDDLLAEGNETFDLVLTNVAGVNLVGVTVSTVTILDNDTNYNLSLGVSVAEPVYQTSNFVYVLSVTNNGPAEVTGVTLTNLLPSAVTFLGQSNTLGAAHVQAGNFITFDLGSLAVGAVAEFYLTNTAPAAAGFITNSAGLLPLTLGVASDTDTNDNFSTLPLLIRTDSPFVAVDANSTRLTAESLSPINGAVDPGETVTLNLALRNIGNLNTTGSIVATLLAANGIAAPSAAQNYGPLAAGGASVSRSYTFTANGTNGQIITAEFQLTDNGVFLSNNIVRIPMRLGTGSGFTNAVAITIGDAGVSTPYPSTLTVSNLLGVISRVTVTLSNLTHTYPADLDLLLVSPSGEKVILMSDAGAAPGVNAGAVNNVNITFDDSASLVVPQFLRLTNGMSYRPADYDNPLDVAPDVFPAPAPAEPYQTSLAAFNGLSPNGVWSLYVVDDELQNLGSLGGWSLNITAVSPVSPTAALSLTMTPATNSVFVGSNLVYQLVVTNHGPNTATGIRITNTLPANVTLVAATNASGSFTAVGGRVAFNVGSLVIGGVSTNYLEIIPRVAGTLANSATVTALEVDPYTPNNTAVTNVTAVAQADLAVSQAVAGSAALGGSLTNVITVSNLGPSPATEVRLTNFVPANATVTSRSSTQGSVSQSGSIITASLGTLASNATAIVTVVMTPTAQVTLNHTSIVTSAVVDLNLTNNTAVATTLTTPSADLAVSMTAAPNPVVVTSNLTYSIVVTNRGQAAAAGVTLTDVLPGSLTFISASVSQGSAADSGGTITWNIGSLASGASVAMTLNVSPNVTGGVNNSVSVTASTPDPSTANNTATVTVTVNNRAPSIEIGGFALVSETGGVLNGQLDPGENVTLSVALRNKGGSNTVNLVASLLNSGGVSFSGSQVASYGVLVAGGNSVSNNFSFTANGTNGGVVVVSLQLEDRGASVTNALGVVNLPLALGAVNSFTNSAQIVITDNSPASPYPSTNVVSGLSGAILDVNVTLHGLSHSYPDDVNILLVSPSGRAVMLMSDAGGSGVISSSSPATLVFDDAASGGLPNESLIASGTYRPSNYLESNGQPASTNDTFATPPAGLTIPSAPYSTNLSVFNGSNPNGAWHLYIMDDSALDAGVILNGWSLRIASVTTVNPSVDLALGLAASPSPAHVGSNLTFTVVVTNLGPNVATNVVISNFLPAGMTFVSAANALGAGTNHGGGLVTLGVPTLDIGTRATNTIVVTPTVLGTASFTASVTAAQAELVSANNSATLVTDVFNLPVDLALTVTASTNLATVGGNLTYTIVVTNLGPNTATGARVTNAVDASASVVSATAGGGGTAATSGQIVVFSLPSLLSGGQVTNLLVIRPNFLGSITNTATAAITTQTETNLVNNVVTTVTVVEGVQFNAGASTVTNGGSFVLSLTGRINKTYVIEASTNLVDWTPIHTNTSLSGAVSFVDTNAASFPSGRFYRAIER
jgi:uncharacterized repeat protein (TIGR01451 family)/uncharacterized delta-60 repeat protein